MKKIMTLSMVAVSAMFFSACTSGSGGINMDKQTPSFQNGAAAGCETAKGTYTKDHDTFGNDMQYQNGWFYGRKKCNPADSKH